MRLQRYLLAIATVLGLLCGASLAAQAAGSGAVATTSDLSAYAVATGTVSNHNPKGLGTTLSVTDGSDMDHAFMHDQRWITAAATHKLGVDSRIEALLTRGNTFFLKTGDAFGKILQAYQDINKMVMLYNEMKSMADFMSDFHLNVNLMAFCPMINVDAPDEMGGGTAFAVGLLPADSHGWQARANLFGDNTWYKPLSGGLRLVSVRYPHSLNDITMDSSMWANDSIAEDEFQKRAMAGIYDGAMSASLFLNRAGVQSNLADNVANLGPKAQARMMSEAIQRRITSLEQRKYLLTQASMGDAPLPPGMTPQDVLNQITAITTEEQALAAQDQLGEANITAQDEAWMRQASFITEILTKLEKPERRLALMKLNERYLKYEKFWATPSQMDPTPDITGDPRVDNAIYIIWQALTLLSKGKIPPPTPVPGGPAAEAQATMVRSMYRQFTVDELRAVRRLIEFRYESDLQEEAATIVVPDGQQEVAEMNDKLQAGADRIARLQAYANARKVIEGQNPGMFASPAY